MVSLPACVWMTLTLLAAFVFGQEGASPARGTNPGNPAAATPLSRDEAVRLALLQASSFQQAQLNERIAAEDARQARSAFLPHLDGTLSYIYTSPSSADTPEPVPSFIAANDVHEYLGLASISGEVDVAGRLRATLKRDRALLEAAHAGTEVARRALVKATDEAYFGLALAEARRHAAELSLTAAQEFEKITGLMVQGGEVAEIDLVRARLQTTARRDELERADADEAVAAGSLRLLVGFDFEAPIAAVDLTTLHPQAGEVDRFTADAITVQPAFIELDAARRAAEQEIRLAHAERLPQLVYNLGGGFDTGSVERIPFREHSGWEASVGLTIPLFDWGASKSRELQAKLRLAAAESASKVAKREIRQQFHAARIQALSAASRIQLAEAGIDDAQRNVTTSIARYRAGESSILEATDAQGTLAAQRLALAQALYDYQIALSSLKQVAGE
jgi:outer membrane protein TolC